MFKLLNQRKCIDLWKDLQKDTLTFKQGIFRKILAIPAGLWFVYVSIRRIFLKNRKKDKKPLVISIGNVEVGGSGKTPFTVFLAKKFFKKGLKVAILSHGYKSALTSIKKIDKEDSAHLVGDEARLVFDMLNREVSIYSGPHREQFFTQGTAYNYDVILCDDAFQSVSIKRNIDIVLLAPEKPLEKLSLLPQGTLREPLSSLKYADLIILFQENSGVVHLQSKSISYYTQADVIQFTSYISGFYSPLTKKKEQIRNRSVGIFSALANPEKFLRYVSSQEARVVKRLDKPDHASFSFGDLQKEDSSAIEYWVCSQKDAVKLDQKTLSWDKLLVADYHIEPMNKDDKIIETMIEKWVFDK